MARYKVGIGKYIVLLGIDSFQTHFLLVQVREQSGLVSLCVFKYYILSKTH